MSYWYFYDQIAPNANDIHDKSMKWSFGPQGSLECSWGSPERPQGSPESWDFQRLGIPWLPGWVGLVDLAPWKARRATKNLFAVLCWIIFTFCKCKSQGSWTLVSSDVWKRSLGEVFECYPRWRNRLLGAYCRKIKRFFWYLARKLCIIALETTSRGPTRSTTIFRQMRAYVYMCI